MLLKEAKEMLENAGYIVEKSEKEIKPEDFSYLMTTKSSPIFLLRRAIQRLQLDDNTDDIIDMLESIYPKIAEMQSFCEQETTKKSKKLKRYEDYADLDD